MIDFLYEKYGKITPQNLDEKTTSTKYLIYNTSQTIDKVFNKIYYLVDYVIAADAELTEIQTISLILIILNKQIIFKDNIQTWK